MDELSRQIRTYFETTTAPVAVADRTDGCPVDRPSAAAARASDNGDVAVRSLDVAGLPPADPDDVEVVMPNSDQQTSGTRSWMLVAAAAAAVAVVVGLVAVNTNGDDGAAMVDLPAPDTDVTGPATTVSETEATDPATSTSGTTAVGTVRDLFGAFNAGDVEGVGALAQFGDPVDARGVEALMIANARWTEVEPCRHVDRADLEIREWVDWGPEHEGFVHCVIGETDDFFGPAGLDRVEVFECGVTAEPRVLCATRSRGSAASADDDAIDAYLVAFWDWVRTERPDTYAEIGSSDGELPGSRDDPGQMTVALSVLDDFLDQSDRYPLG